MKKRKCFYLAALVFYCLGCGESKETRMQRFLIQGNEKIRKQEYEQAEKFFLSAIGLDSCFADAWNNLGTVEQRRQNLEKSASYYSRALACRDTFFLARLNRATVYFDLNDTISAWKDVAILEKHSVDSSRVDELKALLFWKTHRHHDAIATFRHILERNHLDKNALINLGTLYTALKRPDSASYFLNRALSEYPNEPELHNAMSMLMASKGNLDEANEWISKALVSKPDNAYFLNNKGYILLLKNENEEAIRLIDDSIVRDPYNAWAYRNKGIFYYNTGRYEDSWRLLRQAEKMDSHVDDLYAWLGRCRLKMGEVEEACALIQKAVSLEQWNEKDVPQSCH